MRNMNKKALIKAILYSLLICLIEYNFFGNLSELKSLKVKGSINHFDIIKEYPEFWAFLNKYIYISTFLITTTYLYRLKEMKLQKFEVKNYGYDKENYYTIISKFKNNENKKKNKGNNEEIRKSNNGKIIKQKQSIIGKTKYEINRSNEKGYFDNNTEQDLNILLGFGKESEAVYLSEKGLFQNVLITGSIGSGKTSSAVYQLTKKLLRHGTNEVCDSKKIGMLILDVKGNYYEFVEKECKKTGRENDLLEISLDSNIYYNPLNKMEYSPKIIASRLKYILLLFSPNNSESFWLDKAETVIAETIKYIRIYNEGYVNFDELHKIITDEEYYFETKKKLKGILKRKMEETIQQGKNNIQEIIYELNTFINFYEKEFIKMDPKTKNIIKAEISRITNLFITDYKINKHFSPKKEEINFNGFEQLIKEGKIVVLNMNISEYGDISKVIACYLKLDFQAEVLKQLGNGGSKRITAFISDEYQEYVTKNDANFYSQSREAMCINVISTQSFTSLKNALKEENSSNVIIQSLVNKICFRTDDEYTIEKMQKLIGKEEKEKKSITIGESSKDANYSFLAKEFISDNSSLSESVNRYSNFDYRFDYKFFTQELNTFEALGFISDGNKIKYVNKINMIPYFLD